MAIAVDSPSREVTPGALWAGRILSGLVTLFFLMDAIGKFARPEPVVKATVELGFSESAILPIGAILLVCTLLYAIPRTAVLGAILLTGYLGGAVATHLRMNAPAFNLVFPIVFGAFVWAGLLLRDRRLLSALLRTPVEA